MDETDNTMPIEKSELVETREPLKLPGLRPTLNARKIERKVLARQTGIDLNRLSNIVGTSTRATVEEIDRITQALGVPLEQLLEPDMSPPRRRSSHLMALPEQSDDEDDAVNRDALPALPEGDVVLNIALPDGRKFSVGSNQTLSATMLMRMSQALAILAGTNDEK